MSEPAPPAPQPTRHWAPTSTAALRRLRRPAAWSLAIVVLLVFGSHLVGGWYFASRLDDRALSAESRRAALVPNFSVHVIARTADSVTLEAPGERRLAVDGVFGLVWRDGRGILGHVLQASPDGTVTRQFHDAAGTPLKEGELTAFDSRVYGDDPLRGRGVSFEDISLRGELGDYPAWLIPGRRSTWFIFVHGNAMTRLDGLRVLSTVVEAEMPMLIPTYRGDEQAPAPGDGHLTYGKREWRDIETAVQYALDHGAESVVLEGVSMGGAIVTAFLLESPLAAKVSGVILDAPVLSFREAVEFQAGRERLPLIGLPLPGTLVDVARWLASARFDVDWDYTDYLDRIGRLVTPILLIHGAADRDVPLATSQQLASARPDLVTDFYVATGAGHVEAWNVDPDEYERRLLKFLRVIGALD